MIRISLRPLGLAAIFSLALIVQSCKKESNVGSTLIPDDDILDAILTDTFTIEAHTELADYLNSELYPPSTFGEFNDPDFGITNAQFFSQVVLSQFNVSFGASPELDSVILSIDIDTTYGQKGGQSTVKVYQLDEAMTATKYYSTDSVKYSKEIGSGTINTDTGTVKINLSKSFGEFILNASSTDLGSKSAFTAYLFGLTMKAIPTSLNAGEGTLYVFDPEKVKITLYYHNGSTNNTFDLKIPSSVRHFVKSTHNFSGATDLANQLMDSTLGKDQLFLKWAGTKVSIRFPYINDWVKDKKVFIHRAELVLPIKSGSNNTYPAPTGTWLYKDTAHIFYQIPDYADVNHKGMISSEPGATYGGGLSNGEYRFLITRYLQNKISLGESSTRLLLTVGSNSTIPGRILLNGTNPTNPNRIKLLVYYSIAK
ncbi:MAG: DUF4270 family protein [Flavobacteriales bacterium]